MVRRRSQRQPPVLSDPNEIAAEPTWDFDLSLSFYEEMKKRLVVVGIGGASCSGKTLLAKHVRRVLPSDATIIHQDDFAPPIEQVPFNPKYPELQDWDDPPTCILWPAFLSTLRHVRSKGELPDHHLSHDHLNKQVEVAIDTEIEEKWRTAFRELARAQEEQGVELVWFLVDGFVLYWDKVIVDQLDVRIFLRVPHDLLKTRREERQVYVLQNPDDAAAGGVWTDPPQYFDKIVYPAYVKAHQHMFANGDVEAGEMVPEWKERQVVALQPGVGEAEMTRAFDLSCSEIVQACREGKGSLLP